LPLKKKRGGKTGKEEPFIPGKKKNQDWKSKKEKGIGEEIFEKGEL